MGKKMTMAEMESKYDSEWVLIEDPEVTDEMKVVSGKLLYHSPDRDAVRRKMAQLKPKHSAVLFVGQTPADMAFAL
jgi:hypothetical protein